MSAIEDQILFRRSVSYLLDQLAGARVVFDILDSLIAVPVAQANVAPIISDRSLQLRYAMYDQPPPDELRRPISVNALAESLRLPFETVRRRLIKLSLLGVCRSGPGGVVVPTRAVFVPLHRGSMQHADALTAQFWRDAAPSLGPSSTGALEAPAWPQPPLRLVARLAFDYVLRLAELFGEVVGDPTAAVIWAAVMEGGDVPLTRQAIARRVQLPVETVRRRAQALETEGLLHASSSGLVVSGELWNSASLERVAARNRGDVVRLFGALSDFGVVQRWGVLTERAA